MLRLGRGRCLSSLLTLHLTPKPQLTTSHTTSTIKALSATSTNNTMGFDQFLQNAGGALTGTGAAIAQFNRKTLAPVLAGTATVVNNFGRETAKTMYNLTQHKSAHAPATADDASNEAGGNQNGPALDQETTKDLDESARPEPRLGASTTASGAEHNSNSSTSPTRKQLTASSQSTLKPTRATKALTALTSKSLTPLLPAKLTTALLQSTTHLLTFWRQKVSPAYLAARKHIREHPGQAALILGSALLVVFPTLVITPALLVLGMGSGGVVAGSLAAAIQGLIGNVAAGSLFAILQSAAMGGYGLAIVAGTVQAGGGVALGLAGLYAYMKNRVGKNGKAKED